MGILGAFVLVLGLACGAWAGETGRAVDVQIRSDSGRILPLYPISARFPNRKMYAEAVKGDQYSIVVRNLLDRKVGVVIAVDGRNIVSGAKSWLRNNERMYILEPYGQGEFKGWRTSLETIHRFYFTEVADSYAAAFGDESAMGVIAVAVYPEVQRVEAPSAPLQSAPQREKRSAPADAAAKSEMESAGTGFGHSEHSPVRLVSFDPEAKPAERVYIKYEWRSTLCRLEIASCGAARAPRNRLWDDSFAPYPPGR